MYILEQMEWTRYYLPREAEPEAQKLVRFSRSQKWQKKDLNPGPQNMLFL